MKLTRFDQVAAFYQASAPYLLDHEAEHNLILGLCGDIERHPERYQQQPYFAVVREGDQVMVAALMTPPHNLVVSLCALPAALDLLVDDVLQFARPPAVTGPAALSGAFAQTWRQHGYGDPVKKTALRIYRLDHVLAGPPVLGQMRRAKHSDIPLLIEWFNAFECDALHAENPQVTAERVASWLESDIRGLYLWEVGDQPVAMAGHSGPTPNSMRINAVYTPRDQRRNGYARALVAALSQHLLDSDRQFCTLFTDLANPTSNHIYQTIGYQPVIDVDEWWLTLS